MLFLHRKAMYMFAYNIDKFGYNKDEKHMLIRSEECENMKYRFHKQVSRILKEAANEAKDMGNNYIGSEHLLLAILKDTTVPMTKLLGKQEIYYDQLKEDLMVLFGLKDKDIQEIQMTQVVDDILEHSYQHMVQQKEKEISVDMLTLSLLETNNCVANEILGRYDICVDGLRKELSIGGKNELDSVQELRNLNKTQNNRDIVGREQELDFMISVLSRKDKANPLLVGEPGVGKTALVEKLAAMIEQKQVPIALQEAKIYELHLNTLVAGTKYRGDFEEKLQKLIQLIEKHPHVILFIDEIHQMIGAGKSEGSIDVASVLKPYLARGVIKCIGATTVDEYEKYIEKDRALERRFQVIMIKEPDQDTCERMLASKVKEYEDFHHVKIHTSLLHQMIAYCDYYMPQRKFPDKAIDLLDLSCVQAQRHQLSEVNEDVVRSVIEQLTDIPLASKNRLEYVHMRLQERLLGQQEVIDKVMRQITWMEQGVIQNHPLGVWLFLGEAGTGKKTLMKEFTRAYFNQENMIEIDAGSPQTSLEFALVKIKRNPYTTIHVANLQEANSAILSLLQQSIQKGFFEVGNQCVDLRHSIIIMTGDFAFTQLSALRFQAEQTHVEQLEKVVGKEFLQVVDEIFEFQPLSSAIQADILKQRTRSWRKQPNMEQIHEALAHTQGLLEADKYLKQSVGNIG